MKQDIITDRRLLNIKSESVTDFKAVQEIIDDLLDTAKANASNCAGLAANQIGHNLRVAVYIDKKGQYQVLINPKLISRSKEISAGMEGCLSRPDSPEIKVRRHKWVKLKEYDPKTKTYVKRTYKGYQSRIVQHELDHMNGKLI